MISETFSSTQMLLSRILTKIDGNQYEGLQKLFVSLK